MTKELSSGKEEPKLPALPAATLPALGQLTEAMGVPREVLASDDEIICAWRDLPRELCNINPEVSGELIARMCVAISSGLFDGAISYVWNASILCLRDKVRKFGLQVVNQILEKEFEERELVELQDNRLLDLCLKLNLINEDAYFFLDQCRDIRNNFSAAHPPIGNLNDRELIVFINRCIRYALGESSSPQGVNIREFISAIKGNRFSHGQSEVWIERLRSTHAAQRQLLIGSVHGIYCDPDISEQARLNALEICDLLKDELDSQTKSNLITRHSDYLAKGDNKRHAASQQYFEKIGLLNLLDEQEQHTIFHKATQRLMDVHMGMDNFYNEPPFAERLLELSAQGEVPDSMKEEYVNSILACYIGNGFGVSRAAIATYEKLIKAFSPKEVLIAIRAGSREGLVARRIKSYPDCKKRYQRALLYFDEESIPRRALSEYHTLLNDN